jgi:hypothetical protein
MTRPKVLSQLAADIVLVTRSHPLRVAIDGINTAGKTMLALATPVARSSTPDGIRPLRRIDFTILPSALKANGSA